MIIQISKKAIAWLICLTLSILANQNVALGQENLVVPDEGTTLLLGTGYDSVTGRVKDRCVVGNVETETIGGDGGTTVLTHDEISSRREYRSTLKLGASGSFGIGGFAGSAKTDLMTQEEFNSHSYMLLARIQVTSQSQVLSQYNLLPNAKELLASDKDAFLRVCGDSFVAARVTGGEFAALIRLETEKNSTLSELSGSFKANYLSASGSTSASNSVQQVFERHKGTIKIIRRGGVSQLPEFWKPADVRDYTRNFPTEVVGENANPVTYSVSLVRYADILDAVSLAPITVTSSRKVIEELADRFVVALDLHDNITYVIENATQFPDANISELVAADEEVVKVLNEIRDRASSCASAPDDVKKCKFSAASEFSLPNISLPPREERQFRLARSKHCGVEGYETSSSQNECRHSSHGMEVVETRTIVASRKCEGFALLTKEQHCEREFRKQSAKMPSNWGFDQTWRFSSVTPAEDTGTCDGGAFYGCDVILERVQPKLARSEACGSNLINNYEKPIFKECRHAQHGFE